MSYKQRPSIFEGYNKPEHLPTECPACHEYTLPPFLEGEVANAVACQNPKCRVIVTRNGVIDGQWSKGYKETLYDN